MTQDNFSHKTQQTGSIFRRPKKLNEPLLILRQVPFTYWATLTFLIKDPFGGTYLLFVLSALAIRFELSMVEGKGDRWSAGDNWNRSS